MKKIITLILTLFILTGCSILGNKIEKKNEPIKGNTSYVFKTNKIYNIKIGKDIYSVLFKDRKHLKVNSVDYELTFNYFINILVPENKNIDKNIIFVDDKIFICTNKGSYCSVNNWYILNP